MRVGNIIIPETFRLNNKKITVEMKSEIQGDYEYNGDTLIFHSSYPACKLEISLDNNLDIDYEYSKSTLTNKLCKEILNIFYRGLTDISSLNSSELNIFYFIKNVKNRSADCSKILIITSDQAEEIKKSVLHFKANCEVFSLEKCVEMYMEERYDKILIGLKKRLAKEKYTKFIMYIPNLYIPSDYHRTKEVISLLELTGGKILFLTPDLVENKRKFDQLFGPKYTNCVMDMYRYLYPFNSDLKQIENILF